jgi:hypothetical protein
MAKATVYMRHITQSRVKVEVSSSNFRMHAENGVTTIYDPQGKPLFSAPTENVNHVEFDYTN